MKLSELMAVFASETVALKASAAASGTDVSATGRHDSHLAGDPEITSLHYDSRTVVPGGLFVALTGFVTDGHQYISMAIDRGAVAVVANHPVAAPVPTVEVADTRRALAVLAARFYGNPSRRMTLIGITGTNGKTTTSYLIENMLAAAGYKVGVLGTISYRYGSRQMDAPVTTPESADLQRMLKEMCDQGVTHAVMEVSSHALALNRLEGCAFDVGVFTNLTQDHLDFHKDMAGYWNCKKRLFTDLMAPGPDKTDAVAVINQDDPRGTGLAGEVTLPVITVGRGPQNQVRPMDVTVGPEGIAGRICAGPDEIPIHSALMGEYNLENILCAVGAGMALKLDSAAIGRGIEATRSVPGRLEPVANTAGIYVFVDYAHTPDALENALRNLRKIARGRLICIAGCGGDRDRTKRPLMAGITAKLSDLSILTSDNPRSEDPLAIIEDMVAGVNNGCRRYDTDHLPELLDTPGYVVEPDRRRAIRLGIDRARAGDIVLIAGKGHETYQIIAGRRIDFDDRREAAAALMQKDSDPAGRMDVGKNGYNGEKDGR